MPPAWSFPTPTTPPPSSDAPVAGGQPKAQASDAPVAGGQPKAQEHPRERGFSLLAAIWAMALLAFLAVLVVQSSGRHAAHVRLARDLAIAEAAADAGVTLAILDLMAAREERRRVRRFALGGAAVRCRLEDGVALAIAVADEAGRVDLNQADERLLVALVMGLGADRARARQHAAAIADFRDRDDSKRTDGAEAPDYRAAGRDGPKNAPFAHIDELAQVLGLEPDDVARLRPHVTIFSALPGLDPGAASDALKEILARGAAEFGLVVGSRRDALPAAFAVASPNRVYRVSAEAHTAGAVYHREAVLQLGEARDAYDFRAWRRAGLPLLPAAMTAEEVAALVPC